MWGSGEIKHQMGIRAPHLTGTYDLDDSSTTSSSNSSITDSGMLTMIDEGVDTFDSFGFAFCDITLIAM